MSKLIKSDLQGLGLSREQQEQFIEEYNARIEEDTNAFVASHPSLIGAKNIVESLFTLNTVERVHEATRGLAMHIRLGKQFLKLREWFDENKSELDVDSNTWKLFVAIMAESNVINQRYSQVNQFSLIASFEAFILSIPAQLRLEAGCTNYKDYYQLARLMKIEEVTPDMTPEQVMAEWKSHVEDKASEAETRKLAAQKRAESVVHSTVDIALPTEENPDVTKQAVHISAEGFDGQQQAKVALLNKLLDELGPQALSESNQQVVAEYYMSNATVEA